MTDAFELRNGRVVTPTGVIADGHVVIADDRIVRVGEAPPDPVPRTTVVDVGGRVVLPGLVDLHGDDVERHRAPRTGARVDAGSAVLSADRTNVVAGVTTKFHAIAFEADGEDARSVGEAETLVRAVDAAGDTLADNRVHVRADLSRESVDAVERVVAEGDVSVDLLSVMRHVPGEGQFDEAAFERHYAEDRNVPPDAVERLSETRAAPSPSDRDDLVARVADLAADADVPLASHDDETAAAVERMADRGASISEYPLTVEAAERAVSLGMTTAMGAPNLVRGESLWGNLSARSAVRAGAVDALCSDYHPPSLLAAPFVETGESLSTRVNRVTRNPAEAVGLHDRGRLEVGARADVIVVEPSPTPSVERVFVAGSEVLRSGPRRERSARRVPFRGSGS
ncbi:alpha-D-ribose 1-methylphosphonate 5-triphosphate diphosphatase [Halorubrum sp. Atlit-26R]|uniref:alpha-D-ribose 1-methylphosphonate 5-triphosphate diphosphatase n=1 Tax=Halorubrum sp. Atlit-26R TaxID=2282128 RepID=UPI000EF21F02|nr:alpha-D-ribose 1-methylphosphonate 5-triphosphate diphosphatase [Halorubrum sp. Atlit-26R]RLM64172.1 alpha-D-ribose 1-methylphosphonate 5-triphosphate diphosphatase [Halorubrum sp. Atlit-26R]